MSGANGTIAVRKGTSTLVRPTFAAGMLLQHEDMELLAANPAELSRLLFRSLFGCGVVCGLVVRSSLDCGRVCITVGAGLGLDCSGAPIYVPTDQTFALDPECDPKLTSPLWVILCRTAKRCAPRPAMCGCEEEETSMRPTRERDGYEIKVVMKLPECVCGGRDLDGDGLLKDDDACWCVDPEHPYYVAHYAGKCDCECDECTDCEGRCIVLAQLTKVTDPSRTKGADFIWQPDHKFRRFIRPVLMRDPQAVDEQKAPATATTGASLTADTSTPKVFVKTSGKKPAGKEVKSVKSTGGSGLDV
jgi:hypothetical protein